MPLLDIKPYDRQYYETVLRPFLPRTFIDCHAHIWLHEFHREGGLREGSQNWPRLVAKENPIEDLKETNRLLFPENQVISVVYGDPVVTIDRERNNRYVAEKARENRFPALYLSHPSQSPEELEQAVLADPVFRGIKVYLQFSPAYIPADEIRIYDFLPKEASGGRKPEQVGRAAAHCPAGPAGRSGELLPAARDRAELPGPAAAR